MTKVAALVPVRPPSMQSETQGEARPEVQSPELSSKAQPPARSKTEPGVQLKAQPGAESAIHRVAIIGAGAGGPVNGAYLALLSMRAGFATVLEDVLPSHLRRAAQVIGATDPALTPRYATSIEDAVRNADLVLDTVPDELESKLEILSLLDRMAPPHTLFATPTETLSIADLASCTYRPGQCFGLRFLSLQPLRIALSYSPAAASLSLSRVTGFLVALGADIEYREDRQALP